MSSSPEEPSTKTILVTGATGRQGLAVVRALSSLNPSSSSSSPPSYTILALTRSLSSPPAQHLLSLSLPHVHLLQGNLDDPEAIFASASTVGGRTPIWGVFSMQNNRQGKGGVEGERKQGMALAREAERRGTVKCFVYSGVYRGVEGKCGVPQFDSKRDIEIFLKTSVPELPWTILQPVYFMDNLSPSATSTHQGKLLATMLLKKGAFAHPQTDTLQLVAVSDVGRVAAAVFQTPTNFTNQTLPLAGSTLTLPVLLSTYKEIMRGKEIPTTFTLWAIIMQHSMRELRTMFKFFGRGGEGVDIPALERNVGFGMKTWGEFLRSEC